MHGTTNVDGTLVQFVRSAGQEALSASAASWTGHAARSASWLPARP
jgi:hypothetical protein